MPKRTDIKSILLIGSGWFVKDWRYKLVTEELL